MPKSQSGVIWKHKLLFVDLLYPGIVINKSNKFLHDYFFCFSQKIAVVSTIYFRLEHWHEAQILILCSAFSQLLAAWFSRSGCCFWKIFPDLLTSGWPCSAWPSSCAWGHFQRQQSCSQTEATSLLQQLKQTTTLDQNKTPNTHTRCAMSAGISYKVRYEKKNIFWKRRYTSLKSQAAKSVYQNSFTKWKTLFRSIFHLYTVVTLAIVVTLANLSKVVLIWHKTCANL